MHLNRAQVAGINRRGGQSLAGFVAGLGPAAWFRFNTGITSALGLVSQWDDVSGNGRHLLQATETNQPTLEADGSITFDGVDNYLKCDAFTLDQPETVYLLMKQVTWTVDEYFVDGNASQTGGLQTITATPSFRQNAGAVTAANENLAVDAYGVVSAVFNGASSLSQVNLTASVAGDAGASNMGGFTLAARGTNTNFAHIQVKEVLIYAAAHDAATRARVIRYLAQVGNLGV